MLRLLTETKRSDRFDVRLDPTLKQLFKKAAGIQGYTSLSDFILSCAFKEATKVIKDFEVMTLSEKDRETFVRSFLDPQQPKKALVSAAQDYKNKIQGKKKN
jgi:uncharacterized protein (DUF1778 family)